MEITELKLINFRNYYRLNLKFDSKMNLIVGPNGSGKTNIIEAIYVLALTKSFKSNYDEILINKATTSSRIEGKVRNTIQNNYVIEINKDGKKAKIDKNYVAKLSDYISKIQVILFSSNDLKIIKDNPSTRRKLLNIEISQINNEYLKYLSIYNGIMKQRNAYLRILYTNKMASKDYLDILTDKLIKYGLLITKERKKFIDLINDYISDKYQSISKEKSLKVVYISDYANLDEKEIVKKYKKYEEKDIIFGKTNFGIHTDDIEFLLNDDNLREYGSEGQQKNAIIAFKFSELEIFKQIYNIKPILIIDDLYSELDKNKVNAILSIIDDTVQTFITVTDLNKVKKSIKETSKIFKVRNGVVDYEK